MINHQTEELIEIHEKVPEKLLDQFPHLRSITQKEIEPPHPFEKSEYGMFIRFYNRFKPLIEALPKKSSTKRDGSGNQQEKPDLRIMAHFINLALLYYLRDLGFVTEGENDEVWNQQIEREEVKVRRYMKYWLPLIGKI